MTPVNSKPYAGSPVAAPLSFVRHYGLQEIIEALHRKLSESDKKNYHVLEKIFYARHPYEEVEKHVGSVREMFASYAYSDDCKRYFAATHSKSVLTLLLGDHFLTEDVILSTIKEQSNFGLESDYVDVVMLSSHLSEFIISAMFEEIGPAKGAQVLEATPDSMITAGLLNSWVTSLPSEGIRRGQALFIAKLIRRAHPEYEGLPDEWVRKAFCGQ